MTETALVHHDHGDITAPPSPLEWQALREQAEVIAKSGLAPSSVNTFEKVLTISLKGRELRVPPMQALSHIHVIDGKPTLSAELMTSLVRRAGHRIRVVENTDEKCVVQGVRGDDPDYPLTVTWTMDTAHQAGVTGKGNWKTYPAAMLLARATSQLCRALFSDVLMGASYTPEELGADVDPETGEILTVEVEHAYRDPDHTQALADLEQVITEAHAAAVEFDEGKAREYAALSAEHARSAARNLQKRIHSGAPAAADAEDQEDVQADDVEPEVVDAEIVEDDPAPEEPAEVYDWKAHATEAAVTTVDLLNAVREAWPRNDMARQPNRKKDLDLLAEDPELAPFLRATVDDLAGTA